MNVINIIVLSVKYGADVCMFELDIPSGIYPYEGNQWLKCEIAKGQGLDYCMEHFPNIPIELKTIK